GDIAIVVAGALAGGFVNGLTGTGYALVALGFWLQAMSPVHAAPLVAFCSVIGHLQSLPSIWHGVRWPRLWPFLVAGLIGVPLGTMLLERVPVSPLKLGVGLLLIFYSSWMGLVRRPPIVTGGGRLAEAAAGFLRGRMGRPQRPRPGHLGSAARLVARRAARRQPAVQHGGAYNRLAVGRRGGPARSAILDLGPDRPADHHRRGTPGIAALWPHRRARLSPAGPDVAGAVGSDIGSLIAAMKRETFAAVFVALCAVAAVTTLTVREPGSPPSPDTRAPGPTTASSGRAS